ncbi:CD209 antigen-like protein D isoform X2 [Esox lucius]|uniref:CD209 antigen-like protein D isoform X2 n=1 Tax=Esox lucius TaxID=8010 RepID=UPI0014771B7C|nr:CD209 antigen-like protein D isoform X2 [Esox lucius]
MSGEIIYSNVTFSRPQKQDDVAESKVSEARDGEGDVTYSDIRTGTVPQVNVQKESDVCSADPSPPVGSKVVTPERGSQRVVLVTLVCLCVVLLVLSITLGVFYVSNIHFLRAVETNLTQHTSTATRCASGWKFYNGSCYHFSEDKLTWEQSQYACIREGGHLVIIESQQEQDFIRMKVGNTEVKNSYWIGMTDIKEEGVWVWMDNTTLSNNTKYWDLNNGTDVSAFPEPNNWPPGEDCAQMGWRCSVQISCWFDLGCDIPSKRICESRAANY